MTAHNRSHFAWISPHHEGAQQPRSLSSHTPVPLRHRSIHPSPISHKARRRYCGRGSIKPTISDKALLLISTPFPHAASASSTPIHPCHGPLPWPSINLRGARPRHFPVSITGQESRCQEDLDLDSPESRLWTQEQRMVADASTAPPPEPRRHDPDTQALAHAPRHVRTVLDSLSSRSQDTQVGYYYMKRPGQDPPLQCAHCKSDKVSSRQLQTKQKEKRRLMGRGGGSSGSECK